MFEDFLEELGLSDKEARVYVMLLEVDSASINEIATKTGINRTTVYPVLETLSKKGLASEVQTGRKTTYSAEPPERLETYVERQKVLLDEKSARLKDMIPQLKSIERESGERPIVKYFEGRDGVISAYTDFYEMHNSKAKDGYFIYNVDLIDETFTPEEQSRFKKIRVGKNVYPNTIYNRKEGDKDFPTEGNRVRVDEEKYPILTDILIIEDRTIITTLSEKVTSIVIKSKDIAVTLASLVRLAQEKEKRGGD